MEQRNHENQSNMLIKGLKFVSRHYLLALAVLVSVLLGHATRFSVLADNDNTAYSLQVPLVHAPKMSTQAVLSHNYDDYASHVPPPESLINTTHIQYLHMWDKLILHSTVPLLVGQVLATLPLLYLWWAQKYKKIRLALSQWCSRVVRTLIKHVLIGIASSQSGLAGGSIAFPKHIAFVMDGNRRWAKDRQLQTTEGHAHGYTKLEEILDWCVSMGVEMVTVYAFSIENFKRPEKEVTCLMNMAKEKFEKMLNKKDLIEKYDLRVRVMGSFGMLPHDVQLSAAKAISHSSTNNKCILNLCFAYTSREEISQAVGTLKNEINKPDAILHMSDIDSNVVDSLLYSEGLPPPDILVRTSGEIRLSDFLLWQGSFCSLSFHTVNWPDFSEWNLFETIVSYQKNFKYVQELKVKAGELDRDEYLKYLRKTTGACCDVSESDWDEILAQRQQRISNFIQSKKQRDSDLYQQIACGQI